MRLLAVYLLAFVLVAPLAIGCNKKSPDQNAVWSTDGDPKVLIEQLKSKPQMGLDLRIIAVKQLGAMGPRAQEALPHLEKLTKDKNPTLVKEAQDAIAKIKGQ